MIGYSDAATQPAVSSDELVRRAATAVKQGQSNHARLLLQEAVRRDPQNYRAWLWLASIAPTPQASLDCVARAEMLRPNDPAVREARAWAEKRLAAISPANTLPNVPPEADSRSVIWKGSLALMLVLLLGLAALFVWSNLRVETNAGVTAVSPAPAANLSASSRQVLQSPISQSFDTAQDKSPIANTPIPHIPAKSIGSKAGDPRPTWTATPIPSPTPTPAPTYVPTFVSPGYQDAQRPFGVGPDERWIDVNLSRQYLIAYEGDAPVFETYISGGLPGFETVTGQFRIWLRYESQTMDGRLLGYDYYLENVPYVQYFYQDYALHGAYWHNSFGQPMSHGCVNIAPADAGWLFNWASLGTLVNVHY
ncbi:MAG: L,D-transpeptidase family protein [Chloroflexi bacterium]|nr:L,D-transpeptidase family protein [Chloroflexota bacterium]